MELADQQILCGAHRCRAGAVQGHSLVAMEFGAGCRALSVSSGF